MFPGPALRPRCGGAGRSPLLRCPAAPSPGRVSENAREATTLSPPVGGVLRHSKHARGFFRLAPCQRCRQSRSHPARRLRDPAGIDDGRRSSRARVKPGESPTLHRRPRPVRRRRSPRRVRQNAATIGSRRSSIRSIRRPSTPRTSRPSAPRPPGRTERTPPRGHGAGRGRGESAGGPAGSGCGAGPAASPRGLGAGRAPRDGGRLRRRLAGLGDRDGLSVPGALRGDPGDHRRRRALRGRLRRSELGHGRPDPPGRDPARQDRRDRGVLGHRP